MNIYERHQFFLKLAQTPVKPKINAAAGNINDYLGKLPAIVPGIKLGLLNANDWRFLARIIGIIDQSLNNLSDKQLTFYSVSTSNPSITSAAYANHDALTALMRAAQMLKAKLIQNRIPYTPAQKYSEFINPLRQNLFPRLSSSSANIALSTAIFGSPQGSLQRELTNWQATFPPA